jgi:hypothetical protein
MLGWWASLYHGLLGHITPLEWDRQVEEYRKKFEEKDPDCDHEWGDALGLPPAKLERKVVYPNGVVVKEWERMGDYVKKCAKCGTIKGFDICIW